MRPPVGDDVEIFIPSRSRPERSLTLEAMAHGGLANRAVLVVPYAQAHDYLPLGRKHKIKQILRCKEDGIAATRRFIGEQAGDKFVMFDDDLRFYRRNPLKPEDTRLHMLGKHDFFNMLVLISRMLDDFAHVAVSAREGNNRLDIPFVLNSRPLRALAYRKAPFMRCKHGRVDIMEDFDVTLQLIGMGHQNCVISEFAQDQPQTQSAGGCSDYRTHAVHESSVKKMSKLHPGLVKLREKENKTGGKFGKRLEATIYWEKAYKQALAELI